MTTFVVVTLIVAIAAASIWLDETWRKDGDR